MFTIIPVSLSDKAVRDMIRQLDEFQISLYGVENCNLESFESLEKNGAHTLGAYHQSHLVGMGSIKFFSDYAEIKRMFIATTHRGYGLGATILTALESCAKDNGLSTVCLETGNRQHAALHLYQRLGYTVIDKFGAYQPNTVSIYLTRQI